MDEKSADNEEPIIIIIYASAATQRMKPNELSDLLGKARAFNSSQNITGMLIYHDGSFLQILEGPENAVLPLIKKIQKDPRHQKFKLLLKKNVDTREFGEWSMGFVDTTGMAKTMEGFIDYATRFHAALDDEGIARKVLSNFKEGEWRSYVD
ncbi:MAG: hypothetical protein COV66_02390 [Nitrospinae bacterium CG11_big_fil_rev_8_21_14_0_20_45_15]|nr:MAG: hypothetical protein COV66_02390 [Nitrospinae bacterium CG11_big_fil_rev_8_21_14_0_20_45_15]